MLFPYDWNLTIPSIVCFRNQVISLLLLVKQPYRQKAWWLSLEHVFSYCFLSSFLSFSSFHRLSNLLRENVAPLLKNSGVGDCFRSNQWSFFLFSSPVAVACILSNWETNKLVIIHSIFSIKMDVIECLKIIQQFWIRFAWI